MKKRSVLFTLPLISSLFLLLSCTNYQAGTITPIESISTSEDSNINDDNDLFEAQVRKIYATYQSNGGTLTYEEWLNSIKGPQGEKGETGNGIASILKTSTEGLVDTYTITYTNGNITTFTVTNGVKGETGATGAQGEQGIQGIQGIPGADGHTPVITIGENGNWYIDGVDTTKASSIKGETGNGISSIEKTGTEGLVDTYTITYTNGNTTTFTVTNGAKGETGATGAQGEQGIQGIQGIPGVDGHTPVITIGENGNWYIDGVDTTKASSIKGDTGNGIASILKTGTEGLVDTYTITFTNGNTTTFTVTNGAKGETGEQGEQGIQGDSIVRTEINNEYELVVYFSNGTIHNAGKLVFTDHIHEYESIITPATCTENGSIIFNCKNCGHIESCIIYATGHEYTAWRETIVATCKNIGQKSHSCTKCGYIENKETAMHEHLFTEEYVYNANTHWRYCITCGIAVDEEDHKSNNQGVSCATCKYIYPTNNSQGGSDIESSSDGLVYAYIEDSDSYAVVDIGSSTDENIVIQATYNNKPVTSIYQTAFKGITSFKSIVIPDSVTYIANGAFEGCYNLQSVTLPNNIKKIEDNIFKNCSNLTYVSIPSSTEEIGNYAFYNCSKLTNISLNDGIKNIGSYAFYNCDGVISIIIPDSVLTLGIYCFYDCNNLKTLTTGKSLTSIPSYAFKLCNQLSSVVFGNSIRTIDAYSFENDHLLQSIVLGANVEIIGDNAFKNCTSLSNVLFNEKLDKIGSYAFSNCALKSIIISKKVVTIGSYAFYNNLQLESVVIGDEVEIIDQYAFYNCTKLSNIILGSNIHIIYSYAFSKTAIQSMTIPSSMVTIKQYAFSDCKNLTDVVVIDSNNWICNGDKVYKEALMNSKTASRYFTNTLLGYDWTCSKISYTINLDKLSYSACVLNTNDFNQENVEILTEWNGYPVTEIKSFSNCPTIKSVIIPNSIIKINENSFYSCTSLMNIEIPDSVEIIGSYAFCNCTSLTSIEIPNSVTSIGYAAFSRCSSIEEISLPFVGDKAHISTDTYQYPFGYIFGGNSYLGGVETKQYYIASSISSTDYSKYYIPSSLNKVILTSCSYIPSYSFYSCNIDSIEISNSVTSIGNNAFYNCIIKNATVPSLALYHINNSKLEKVIITSGTSIAANALIHCNSLSSVKIPNSITSIGYSAFYKCTSLTSIEIPDSVTTIDASAFAECNLLNKVIINNAEAWLNISFKDLSSNPLYHAHNLYIGDELLTDLVIPNKINTINNYAFSGCTSLTSIEIPNSVTSIGDYAFYNCTSLTSIEIPNSIENTGYCSFSHCTSLISVEIQNNVSMIGYYSFGDCTSLTSITITDSVESIGDYSFQDCSSLITITIKGTKAQWESINKGSFWNNNTGNYIIHCTDGDIYK